MVVSMQYQVTLLAMQLNLLEAGGYFVALVSQFEELFWFTLGARVQQKTGNQIMLMLSSPLIGRRVMSIT